MDIATTIHFVLAYLVVLCGLVFSWNQLGRRVMNVVLGLQVLAGIAVAGTFGASHVPLPSALTGHLILAIVALVAYALARRFGDRPGGALGATVLSVVGLVCIFAAVYLGLHMAGRV